MTTKAPSAARRQAMARPIPRLAPVTSATFPARRDMSVRPEKMRLAHQLTLPVPISVARVAHAHRQGNGRDRRALDVLRVEDQELAAHFLVSSDDNEDIAFAFGSPVVRRNELGLADRAVV